MFRLQYRDSRLISLAQLSIGSYFLLAALVGCSRPVSLKSTLKERIYRTPETASSLGDGDTNIGAGRFKEELSRFNSIQNVPDSDAQFYFLKGELLLSKDKFEEALSAFKQSERRLETPSAVLSKRIIQIYLKEGNLPQAISVAESYHKSFSKDSQISEALAGAYSAVGKNEEAITVYNDLIESSSGKKREEFLMMLASIHSLNKDSASAKKVLKQALKENPKNSLAMYYLGRVQELEGDLTSAEKKYRSAVKETPENDGLQLELARLLAQTKHFAEAKEIAQLVVTRSPQNPLARQLLGQLLLATNNVEGALTELKKLQSLEQNPTDTRLRIALINLERRDFEAAEKELNLVVAARPNDSVGRYYLVLAYAGQNRINDVASNIKKIEVKDKFYVESRLIGAFVLKQANRNEESIALLKDADLKLSSSPDIRILSFLVSALKEQRLLSEAVLYQKKLISIEPDKDSNYFLLAILLDDAKNFEESIAAGKKAIELNPKNADALNFVGYSLAENEGDLTEAKKFIKAALELEPKNGYFIDSLGWVYFKENNFTAAVTELERAVELVPSDAVILEHLANAYLKVKDFDKSLSVLTRALQNADRSDDKGVLGRLKELENTLRNRANK